VGAGEAGEGQGGAVGARHRHGDGYEPKERGREFVSNVN